jgi:hypothetical protein
MLAVATCWSHKGLEATACAMTSPRTIATTGSLTPTASVVLAADGEKDDEEVDEEPPSSEPDLQPEVRDFALVSCI